MASRWQIWAAFAVIYLVWGSTFFAIAVVVHEVPPLLAAAVRFVLAGGLLVADARWRRGVAAPSRHQWKLALLLGGVFFALTNGGVTWAEAEGLPSSTTAMLIATEPLWMVLIAWGMGRTARPGVALWIGLGIGLVGTALLLGPSETGAVGPAAIVLVGAFAWSLGTVIAPRLASPKDGRLWAGMQMLAGGVLLLFASAIRGETIPDPSSISPSVWLAFAFLVLFGSMLAFTAYGLLVQRVTPGQLSTYAYVNPVVAMMLGAWAGEPMTDTKLWAAALVLVGVIVSMAADRDARRLTVVLGRIGRRMLPLSVARLI